MILLETDATSAEMSRLNPVLVDGDRKVVIDTLYGTGLNSTADTCQFLVYEDFLKYRVAKTAIHYCIVMTLSIISQKAITLSSIIIVSIIETMNLYTFV